MMLGIILISLFVIEPTQSANKSGCVNLSHEYKKSEITVRIQQHGCDKWSSVQIIDGEPVFTPVEFIFSPNWSTYLVDDEYEKTESRYFINWNRDRTILLKEYVISSYDKKTTESTFTVVSQKYTLLNDDHVQINGSKLVRKENRDGKVEINTIPLAEVWPKI